MDNKDLLKEIGMQVNIVEMHVKRLLKKPEDIGEIDIDMMADKLKKIYSLVFELETGDSIKEIPETPVVTVKEKPPLVEVKREPDIPAPKAPEMKTEEKTEDRGPSTEETIIEEPETSSQEPETSIQEPESSIQDPVSRNQNPVSSIQEPESSIQDPESSIQEPVTDPAPGTRDPEPDPSESEGPKTTADLFSGPTTIAEKFQKEDDNTIAANVSSPTVGHLKTAIGINDKFLFINELFQGNLTEYNEAIEQLNESQDVAGVDQAMDRYKGKYGWSDNSEAYHRLYKIVQTKVKV